MANSAAQLLEAAVRAKVSDVPRLITDIVQDLRDDGWRRLDSYRLRLQMEYEWGMHIRWRKHGAGVAHYVATVPFTQAADWYGRLHEVAK